MFLNIITQKRQAYNLLVFSNYSVVLILFCELISLILFLMPTKYPIANIIAIATYVAILYPTIPYNTYPDTNIDLNNAKNNSSYNNTPLGIGIIIITKSKIVHLNNTSTNIDKPPILNEHRIKNSNICFKAWVWLL